MVSSPPSSAKAWPFEEARKLLARHEARAQAGHAKDHVLFETGYGPSGLPHIGTFGEVVRTTMVRQAFRVLTQDAIPTRLLCVSDDMDGMRKIPENVPNHDLLRPHLQRPLTSVPDPFGTHESFGHHNNARLRGFLDGFGFEYEFASATDLYKSGAFDAMLVRVLERFDAVMKVMLPTLGPERRATYSPVLPVSPKTGRVLYVPMKHVDPANASVTFDDEDGTETTIDIRAGRAKLQWKPDFGMRWAALGVDFEMFGKDHLPNAQVYSAIARVLGAEPPVLFNYELFLDQEGEKISKSKGNGISVEEWLAYATPESLAYYMFQKPKTAKRLHFDVIPKAVDEYIQQLDAFQRQDEAARLENPVWHIHDGHPPQEGHPVSFGLLLNLVAASNAETPEVLWGFIRAYAPSANPKDNPSLDRLVGYAIRYYHERIKPGKTYRAPSEAEAAALASLAAGIEDKPADAEILQSIAFETGKRLGFAENLRDWFKAFYEVVLGAEQGPRFGSFAALYGPVETAALIRKALER
jgi:lysyl-tRNA synthetase, class I